MSLDYCGAPWNTHYGVGGDGGSHSFRNRKAMLKVLEHAAKERLTANGSEYEFFVKTMLQMNQKDASKFAVATKEQTFALAGVTGLSSEAGLERMPLVVAGTQARLSWEERDSLLKHCPEVKTIFPSLHEPACFGAHPKADVCKASICALQDVIPHQGC